MSVLKARGPIKINSKMYLQSKENSFIDFILLHHYNTEEILTDWVAIDV